MNSETASSDVTGGDAPRLSRQPTIPAMLAETVVRCGKRPALGFFRQDRLCWVAWRQIGALVDAAAQALYARGVTAGDRVAQLGGNSPEWIVADLAIQACGAVHVPIHAALPAEAASAQLAHSGATLALVDDSDQARGIRALRTGDCALVDRAEIVGVDADANTDGGGNAAALDRVALAAVDPNSLATILYTSGTTGAPRGVMLTHRQLTANVIAVTDAAVQIADEIRLCVLPLSHIYARTCDLYSWIYRGTRLVLAQSRDTLVADAAACRPTVMNGVPYLYQKIAQALRPTPEAERGAALVQMFGGDLRRLHCGGAAMAPHVEQLFLGAGLPVFCGYGLTEAAPVVTTSTAATCVPGTVGRPLPGVEVQIAADGEVLVRGPNVMQGYWNDEVGTRAAIVDGWLHTGDLGAWHATGNLVITGRKKELIVLSTGKNVAPAGLEALLVSSPFIEQACLIGDRRGCLAALIVPNPEALRSEIRRRRLWIWSRNRAVTHPAIRALYRAEIDACLAAAAPHERVGPFHLLPRGFSIEAGELTPKLSFRREVIERRFAQEIEAMYRARS